jgi:alpha-glucosidase (family GH31 glycosyl hydrolase)
MSPKQKKHDRPKVFAIILGAVCFLCAIFGARAEAPVWGVNAMTLKPAYSYMPSLAEVLTNDEKSVSLDRFFRAGGAGVARESTECRVASDTNSLIVAFRCAEPDLTFPATNRNANWYALLGTPPEQDSAFPDKVDLFIRPDMTVPVYYQFMVTLAGLKFGCERQTRAAVESGEEDGNSRGQGRVRQVNDFAATVVMGTNEWIVFLRIPWKTVGGKPQDCFGLIPVRTRWRDAEVTSPVAFDFTERPPMDLFIEMHFSGEKPANGVQTSLIGLPSGVLRWQRPALLTYPDRETVQAIWRMEQSLEKPTKADNFASRLWLLQRWADLLTLEGFDFRMGRGSIVTRDLSPYALRRRLNATLQKHQAATAWRLLDGYLHELDRASRDWFADGSPGDIGEWTPISRIDGFEADEGVLSMDCLAGSHSVNLHLALPKSGGVRVYGDEEGYFKPAELLPLTIVPFAESFSMTNSDGSIVINQDPFVISFYDTAGNPVTRIGPNDLAFRFSSDGRISAVDFRNNLDPKEVVFGFGERYDRFNENGNVLTLWGMDDWFGNTIGLMNETYKPIALFHSSRGYTVFDNSTYRLRADIGRTDPREYRLTQQGPIFDYYFWIGPPERAVASYSDLTGKPILPPKWAFEPWMGRTGRGWNSASNNAVAEEERVTKLFAKLDIPHSAIYAEGPSADSPELNQFMAARDIKVLSWFWPVISETEQAKLLPELQTNKLPLLDAGSIKASRDLGYIDFSNPNATELLRRWWRNRLNVGVAGSMVDFGDRVPEEATFYDGRLGNEMHDCYAYDYHRTCNEVFREKRGDDFILFGRSAAPGDQEWVAQFAGDHPSNFAGLQSVLTGALNLCACGFSTWGSDLGGFLGWPEPAVYMRWTEFGCFSPLMRCHGRTPREPWDYGDAAVANYKFYAWVRENLLDYIYNSAAEAHETGIPMMRSMAMAYPDDFPSGTNGGEYMFGRDLLVAPVVTENNNKTITLPSGAWTDLWTGRTLRGPGTFTTNVPLDVIPVYLKPGAIVPVCLNPRLQMGQSLSSGQVKALIVTAPEKDEDAGFEYEAAPVSPEPARRTARATVQLHSARNGFTMIVDRFAADYVLVYGARNPSSIRLNGERLPKEVGMNFPFKQMGWKQDTTQNRIIIQLRRTTRTKQIRIEYYFATR